MNKGIICLILATGMSVKFPEEYVSRKDLSSALLSGLSPGKKVDPSHFGRAYNMQKLPF
jgi:hypothetical protein